MRRFVINGLSVFGYALIVVHILRWASPVFEDGYGPEPSFYWGWLPMPGQMEYMARRRHYDVLYALPYWVAGAIIAVIGCWLAPLIARAIRKRAAGFAVTAVVCLALLVATSFAVDAGTLLQFWQGPRLIAHGEVRAHLVWSTVLLPASLLSGVFRFLHRGGENARTLR